MESDLPWRALLEKWPDEWRERWGQRANAIEDSGVEWREAEKLAWNQVIEEKAAARHASAAPTIAMVAQTQARLLEAG